MLTQAEKKHQCRVGLSKLACFDRATRAPPRWAWQPTALDEGSAAVSVTIPPRMLYPRIGAACLAFRRWHAIKNWAINYHQASIGSPRLT